MGSRTQYRAISHAELLLLSEDGIVGLQPVLLEESTTILDLHVKEGVTHAEKLVGGGRHFGGGCTEEGCVVVGKQDVENSMASLGE